jgi:hypothetical protein
VTHDGAWAVAMVEPRTPIGMHPTTQASVAEKVSKHTSIFIDSSET